jgi:predicted RNase H-like nuclease
VRGRRASDRALTRAFVSRGCGTHSPLPTRPGRLADRLRSDLEERGYRLATAERDPGSGRSLIEVYPHPALLELLGAPYRVPYKVGRSARYWPGVPPAERARLLLRQWRRIQRALQAELGPLPLTLPRPRAVRSLASLKATEDALDALISAWVGARALEGRAVSYGDRRSAIWVPA